MNMSIKEITAVPALPAGRTPNEILASPADAANTWLATRSDMLALAAENETKAAARQKVLRQDRTLWLQPLFSVHVAELERKALSTRSIGVGVGVLVGGLWSASKVSNLDWSLVLRAMFLGGVIGAMSGFMAGHVYERVYGPVRPNVSVQLPLTIEDQLRILVTNSVDEEVPEWRVEGWRESWAMLAYRYQGTTMAMALTLPAGAPSLKEMLGAVPTRLLPR
jgi:hypothetical protein